jgi:hypothetical protein
MGICCSESDAKDKDARLETSPKQIILNTSREHNKNDKGQKFSTNKINNYNINNPANNFRDTPNNDRLPKGYKI